MKFRRLLVLQLVPLFILTAPRLSHSAMYKYQDEQGMWVYSQHPPASGDFTIIKAQKQSRSSTLDSEARKAKVNKARESVLGKPGNKKTQSKSDKETVLNEAKRRDICEKSRRGLSALQIYRRFMDENGNVTYMEEDERARRIKNAQANIDQFCD